MYIPSFLKPDFSAGPCCWSHSMRTRLWVVKSVLLHASPWHLCQGKRWSTKGALLLLLRPPALRLSGGRLGGGRFLFTRPRFVVVAVAVAVAVASSVATVAAVRTSCLVSDGADGAGHSGLVRSVTYSMRRSLSSACPAGSGISRVPS